MHSPDVDVIFAFVNPVTIVPMDEHKVDYFLGSVIKSWSACKTNFATHVTFIFTIFVVSRVKNSLSYATTTKST